MPAPLTLALLARVEQRITTLDRVCRATVITDHPRYRRMAAARHALRHFSDTARGICSGCGEPQADCNFFGYCRHAGRE